MAMSNESEGFAHVGKWAGLTRSKQFMNMEIDNITLGLRPEKRKKGVVESEKKKSFTFEQNVRPFFCYNTTLQQKSRYGPSGVISSMYTLVVLTINPK